MLNFALIGCGRIAKRHSDLLGSNSIANAKLVAVCDVVEHKAKLIASKYNIPYFTDMDEMMQNINLQIHIVVILTESGYHAKHTINIAKYGKHIVVEKPMAITLADADSMISVCKQNKCQLFIVKQNRFNLPIVKLKEAIDNNQFGKLILGTIRVRWCRTQDYYNQDAWRGTWALDGGVLTNQASHHIDLLEWMMGEVESVFAKSNTFLVDIEAEDTAVVVLKFKNGALGVIEATTATRPNDIEGSISILGEKGTVEVGGFAVNKMKIWNFIDKSQNEDSILNEYNENPPNVYGFGHKAYYEHIVSSILNNEKPLIDGAEGRKSLELINAMYESIETKKEVFLNLEPKSCKLGQKNESTNN